jgi:hypothetical protein
VEPAELFVRSLAEELLNHLVVVLEDRVAIARRVGRRRDLHKHGEAVQHFPTALHERDKHARPSHNDTAPALFAEDAGQKWRRERISGPAKREIWSEGGRGGDGEWVLKMCCNVVLHGV